MTTLLLDTACDDVSETTIYEPPGRARSRWGGTISRAQVVVRSWTNKRPELKTAASLLSVCIRALFVRPLCRLKAASKAHSHIASNMPLLVPQSSEGI